MKKLLSIAAVLTLVLSLAACGNETKDGAKNNTDTASVETSKDTEKSVDSAEEESLDTEWKQFLQDYEEWVDKYIEITKEYKDNPSDLSVLSDYTDMMTELTEWASKTEKMEKELENASSAELAEYSAELARIAAKLAKVAY